MSPNSGYSSDQEQQPFASEQAAGSLKVHDACPAGQVVKHLQVLQHPTVCKRAASNLIWKCLVDAAVSPGGVSAKECSQHFSTTQRPREGALATLGTKYGTPHTGYPLTTLLLPAYVQGNQSACIAALLGSGGLANGAAGSTHSARAPMDSTLSAPASLLHPTEGRTEALEAPQDGGGGPLNDGGRQAWAQQADASSADSWSKVRDWAVELPGNSQDLQDTAHQR